MTTCYSRPDHGAAASLAAPWLRVEPLVSERIEGIFGWVKTSGGLRKTRHRGIPLVGRMFTFTVAAYDVVRIPKIFTATETTTG